MAHQIARVLRLRTSLLNALCSYAGCDPTGRLLFLMSEEANSILKADRIAIFDSLRCLIGKPIEDKELNDICWRLAGNTNLLKKAQPVYPWSRQLKEEWAPIQALSVHPTSVTSKDTNEVKPAVIYKMRILAGSACPMIIKKTYTHGQCKRFRKLLGFTAVYGKYPYTDPLDVVSMRFMVLLDPELSQPTPGFSEIKCPSGMLSWNKKLLKLRSREQFKCPMDYTTPCNKCWKGYSTCPAACRPTDLVRKFCGKCNNDGWYDNDHPTRVCLDCVQASGKV